MTNLQSVRCDVCRNETTPHAGDETIVVVPFSKIIFEITGPRECDRFWRHYDHVCGDCMRALREAVVVETQDLRYSSERKIL